MDYSQPDTGDTKGHANGNAHADSRLTCVATGHVGPPIQFSADHDDEAETSAWACVDCAAAGSGQNAPSEHPSASMPSA